MCSGGLFKRPSAVKEGPQRQISFFSAPCIIVFVLFNYMIGQWTVLKGRLFGKVF